MNDRQAQRRILFLLANGWQDLDALELEVQHRLGSGPVFVSADRTGINTFTDVTQGDHILSLQFLTNTVGAISGAPDTGASLDERFIPGGSGYGAATLN